MTEAAEITVRGMTLTEYAFVRAGLADGLAVEELLGFLRLDAGAWAAAEDAWEERILDAVGDMDAALLDELDAKTAEARTHWTRRVPPLDEELRAWFAFLHAWQNDPEPADFLQRMSLGAAELAYLHRFWSERMANDAKLREEALALVDGEPGEPPVPAPEPPRLRKRHEAEPAGDHATKELAFAKGDTLPFAEGEPAPMPPPLAVPLPRRARPHTTAPGLERSPLAKEAVAVLPFTASTEPVEPAMTSAGAFALEAAPSAMAAPEAPPPPIAPQAPAVRSDVAPVVRTPPEPTLVLPVAREPTLVLAVAAAPRESRELDETKAMRAETGATVPFAEAFAEAERGDKS
jgi:hypothetical protein